MIRIKSGRAGRGLRVPSIVKQTGAFLFQGMMILPGIVVCLPVLLLLTGSVFGSGELQSLLGPVFLDTEEFISWRWMPEAPTFEHYSRLLFMTPQFFSLFWNSVKLTVLILLGQLLVAVPAAWAFAVYEFRMKQVIFTMYVVLMLLPFQVTMLSQYLLLKELHQLNTHWAIVLPAVFSTFPVFLIYGGFRGIPGELLEAARIDGAGEVFIFRKIGIPLGTGGILSALVLGFLEYWSMMEQPLAFLQDQSLWPLSLYLSEITWSQAGYAFCAAVLTLIPAVFVFLLGQEHLEQGIIYAGLKE